MTEWSQTVRRTAGGREIAGSTPVTPTQQHDGMEPNGKALGLGPRDRAFDSPHPDAVTLSPVVKRHHVGL